MQKRTQICILDSVDKPAGESNDDVTFSTRHMHGTTALKIIAASMPTACFYTIDQYCDTFVLEDTGGTDRTLTLTHGNYTGGSLAAHLQAIITASAAVGTYTVTYNAVNGKLTFTETTPGNFELKFGGSAAAQALSVVVGFAAATYTGAATYTSPNVIDLLGGRNMIYFNLENATTESIYVTGASINDQRRITFILPLKDLTTEDVSVTLGETLAGFIIYPERNYDHIRVRSYQKYYDTLQPCQWNGVNYKLTMSFHAS